MQRGAVSVEANLNAKRDRLRVEKKVTYKEETMASTSDAKIDSLVRKMERMMERINLNERAPPRENQANPQNRIETKISEEILLKSDKEIMTSKSSLLSKKTM